MLSSYNVSPSAVKFKFFFLAIRVVPLACLKRRGDEQDVLKKVVEGKYLKKIKPLGQPGTTTVYFSLPFYYPYLMCMIYPRVLGKMFLLVSTIFKTWRQARGTPLT